MQTLSPAAAALIEALKDPALTPAQTAGLVAALQAVTASAPTTAATAQRPEKKTAAHRERLRGERIALTKTAVAAMPLPDKGERLVYDLQTPQLAVRLRPTGRSYVVSMWDRKRGRRVSHTLGRCMHLTPEQAREQAQGLIGYVAAGEDITRSRVGALTVGELVEKWHAEGKARRTAAEMRAKALDYLGNLEKLQVSAITQTQIAAVHTHIATKGRRRVKRRDGDQLTLVEVGKPGIPATADKWLAIMSSIFNWGCGKGLAAANPCKGIPKAFKARDAARQRYLHGDELKRFWTALESDRDADVRDVLKLALFTGQRKGNVLSMRWDHVDLDGGLWTIPAADTKQKRAQSNPLNAQALAVLKRRAEQSAAGWVFPAVRTSKDGRTVPHMSETRPREAWERITKAANVEGLRIHDLRHTAGSWLARLGANEAVRQKALGHQTPAMAARYSHLELDPVADAMERMGDAIASAATKKARKVKVRKS